MGKKITIKVNSIDKVEQILQENYDLTNKQYNEIQELINSLSTSTTLTEATIEEKTKYAKAMNDFLKSKDSIMARKFEIAKFLGEIIKHGGNLQKTIDDPNFTQNVGTTLDLEKIRAMVDQDNIETEAKIYDIK